MLTLFFPLPNSLMLFWLFICVRLPSGYATVNCLSVFQVAEEKKNECMNIFSELLKRLCVLSQVWSHCFSTKELRRKRHVLSVKRRGEWNRRGDPCASYRRVSRRTNRKEGLLHFNPSTASFPCTSHDEWPQIICTPSVPWYSTRCFVFPSGKLH